MEGGTNYYMFSQNVFLHIMQGYFQYEDINIFERKPFPPFFIGVYRFKWVVKYKSCPLKDFGRKGCIV